MAENREFRSRVGCYMAVKHKGDDICEHKAAMDKLKDWLGMMESLGLMSLS